MKITVTRNEVLKSARECLATTTQTGNSEAALAIAPKFVQMPYNTARALYQLAQNSANESATFDPESPLAQRKSRAKTAEVESSTTPEPEPES